MDPLQPQSKQAEQTPLSGAELPTDARKSFLASNEQNLEENGLPQKSSDRDYIIAPHRRYLSKSPSLNEIHEMQGEIEEIVRGYKLDFFPQIFEVVTKEELHAAAARSGIPVRYPHWKFGMEYDRIATPSSYGLSKISELVINSNPCYAFLLDSNQRFEQRTVIAHVYGHNNFFVRNFYFADSDRKAHNTMAEHRSKILSIIDKHGYDEVEKFIDKASAIAELINPNILGRRKQHEERMRELNYTANNDQPRARRFPVSDPVMDPIVNPPSVLKAEEAELKRRHEEREARFPKYPERDVALFVAEHGQLKDWQREILKMLREEAYYFAPQLQTKIMNEGWASYWHHRIMTEHLNPKYQDEITDYAKFNASVIASHSGSINPYRLGLKLFQYIEERWDKGQFGPEYEGCTDWRKKASWDLGLGQGQAKIKEVRDVYNDYNFINTFLTPEFVFNEKFFITKKGQTTDRHIVSRDFEKIKDSILSTLPSEHRPIFNVVDGNYQNRGELVLEHQYEGRKLDLTKAQATMVNLYALWGRPVHVKTVIDDMPMILSYDSFGHKQTKE